MAGIFGLYSAQPGERHAAIAEAMRQSMLHHPWYVSRISSEAGGQLLIGAVSHQPDLPAGTAASASPRAVIDGELYDCAARAAVIGASPAELAAHDHPRVFAHGFLGRGDEFLRELEGYFSAAIWDESTRAVRLVSDRFGMKPLYYAAVPGGFVFASELKAVLQHPDVGRDARLRGVAQFFSFGHLLGTDTMLDSIEAMPSASIVSYDTREARVSVRRYWRLLPGAAIAGREEGLRAIDEAFRDAVQRRTTDGRALGVSLSGGLDARTILGAMPAGARPVRTVSLGIHGSIDHRIASRLAAIAGSQHHCHFLEQNFLDRFREHLTTLVRLTDGHYLDQAITLPTLPVYRELGIEVLLRGHAGELLHMDKAYSFSINASELGFASGTGVEQWLWKRLTAYMTSGTDYAFFRPALRRDAETFARESLHAALDEAEPFEPPAHRIWHLFITQRLRRETAMSMQMFGTVVDIRLPYLDGPLIDVIMRVPPDLKMSDTVQRYILAQRRPAMLDVINANTGTRIGASPLARELASLRLRVLAKLRVPGYQPYERLGLWLSRELEPVVRNLVLSDRALDRGLFDRESLKRIVDDHATRRRNHTFLLMALMIYELGQRELVDCDASSS